MKIRKGFVSNSSSSSFVVIGALFDSCEVDELCEKIRKEHEDLEIPPCRLHPNFCFAKTSLNPCYTFFLQEKKPKAQLNFHVNKYRPKGVYMSEGRGGV